MELIKGAIHIHSLYSYDGTKSLTEIKHIFKDMGCDFIICTEHAERMEDSELTSFVSECNSLSEVEFIIIPGFEFQCENIEIIGLNISKKLIFSGLNELIAQIQKNGGLAILAHPHKYKFNLNSGILEKLNGVEVWNCRYDGGRAPRVSNIKLLNRLNSGHVFAYAGLDFHSDRQNVALYHCITVEKLNSEEIIKKLKAGRFDIQTKAIELNSKADIKSCEHLLFRLLNLKYDVINCGVNIGYKILRYLHIKPPEFLYRIFAKIL